MVKNMGDPKVPSSLTCTYVQGHMTWLPWQPNINHSNMAFLTFQQQYYHSYVTFVLKIEWKNNYAYYTATTLGF